ncbi:antibiotic biosynthesis monooxygenase [Noviherbaspirillum sp. CPCC 100848]|uniref:Antibiotic biosynthesis monooxygenase n=1 Tax=Noviherbaspirillum album TaxID=3080276 RepID=A0ABU6J5M6_9BURK|nr:antibiotic biosynthesis monooxygenase [Noviherbaspirillum sp. CPCC 100848]MEC4718936.1 antibiotic biosynthesis monooxygenase [Noviherbaspirillum sp. CPCC 100848]
MFAVVFEVLPSPSGYQRYLDTAAALRPRLDGIEGFVSIERFRCLTAPGWILSLSYWRHEAALVAWRGHGEHHAAQQAGRGGVFDDYRLRVVRMHDKFPAAPAQSLIVLQDDPPERDSGRRFQSLANESRLIGLADVNAEAVADDDTASRHGMRFGEVLRDYGLFDRLQAPQRFPAVSRQ